MIKSFLIYFPSILLPRLGVFLIVIVGAHILAPSEYGYFALITIIGEFSEMSVTNWSRVAVARFGNRNGALSRSFILKIARIASICTSLAILVACAAAWALAAEQGLRITIASATYVGAASVLRFGLTIHQALENKKFASTIESVRGILLVVCTLGAMRASGDFLIASIAGSLVNFTAGIFAVGRGLSRTSRKLDDHTALRLLLSFALPLVLLSILSQAITNLDKVLLKSHFDAATLGFYTAAFTISRSGFDIIANAFNVGGFVRLAALFNGGETLRANRLLSRQLAYILAVALPAAAGLIAARQLIPRVLLPPAYFETFINVAPIVALGTIVLNVKNFVFDNIFYMHLRNLRQIPSLVVGAAVSSVVGLVLVPIWPIPGACAMYAAGATVSLAVSIYLSLLLTRLHVMWDAMFAAAAVGLVTYAAVAGLQLILFHLISSVLQLAAVAVTCLTLMGLSLAIAWVAVWGEGDTIGLSLIAMSRSEPYEHDTEPVLALERIVFDGSHRRFLVFTNMEPAAVACVAGLRNVTIIRLPEWTFVPDRLYVPIAKIYAAVQARRKECKSLAYL